MTGSAKIAGVLLAAGRGTRFGGSKLEAMLGDKMLGLHAAQTLAGVGCSDLFAVHDPAHLRLATALAGAGYTLIDNRDPAAGQARSLVLAVKRAMASDVDAILVCLGDMPFVSAVHLGTLLATFFAQPHRIIASAAGEVTSPPAVFPRTVWPALLVMQGDAGARTLLKQAVRVATTGQEFIDVDTHGDLAALQSRSINPF